MSLTADLLLIKRGALLKPAEPDAERIMELVARGTPYDELFFQELQDARWLESLVARGYFATQEPTSDSSSPLTASNGRHHPFVGLVRLMSTSPRAVVDILSHLRLPDDPAVGDLVMRALLSIDDPGYIPLLESVTAQLTDKPSKTSWIWILEVLRNLFALGAIESALTLARGYLVRTLELRRQRIQGSSSWIIKEVDKVLEPLRETHPLALVEILIDAILRFEQPADGTSSQTSIDARVVEDNGSAWGAISSSSWLEEFELEDRDSPEAEMVVASRLYKTAYHIYQTKGSLIPELDHRLRRAQSKLCLRLRWKLYGDFPEGTLQNAREEVLPRIPGFGRITNLHSSEFAHMLQRHSTFHGLQFLLPEELQLILTSVNMGPLPSWPEISAQEISQFRRTQLQPIAQLLKGWPEESSLGLNEPVPDSHFTPSGVVEIEEQSPIDLRAMEALVNEEVFKYLKEWVPSQTSTHGDWTRPQTRGALAATFATFVEANLARFTPEGRWWENIDHPIYLSALLNRALDKHGEQDPVQAARKVPSEHQWATWFGVLERVFAHAPIETPNPSVSHAAGEAEGAGTHLEGAFVAVSRFLERIINTPYTIPEPYAGRIPAILGELVRRHPRYSRAADLTNVGSWLTIAINSASGIALECSIDLATREKESSNSAPQWVADLLKTTLETSDQSPALFAVVGQKLRLVSHLFPDLIQQRPSILFPVERPWLTQALIVAHFLYDRPMVKLLDSIPNLLQVGFQTYSGLRGSSQLDSIKEGARDFGTQLGTHVAFYFWHNALGPKPKARATMEAFFELVEKHTAATVMGSIAWIFRKTRQTTENHEMLRRVQEIGDLRIEQIESARSIERQDKPEFDAELGRLTEWMGCECLEYDWRVRFCLTAIQKLRASPQCFDLLKTLSLASTQPERLETAIEILHALFEKESNELMWSVRSEELGPLLSKGLASTHPDTKRRAERCLEALLRRGKFEFLDLASVEIK